MTKTIEKIINTRLVWYLEKNKILSIVQSGFRRSRSTIDNLYIIKSEINKAFENKQILGMISLDITKAYDSVWRHRILLILCKILINGNMYNYIKNFLTDRKFQVKVSNCLSNIFIKENGIPQESSLAITIFLLAINDIVKTIETSVTTNLFADDLYILCRSNNLNIVQFLLQNSANNITNWLNETGFNISIQKSQSIIFTKKRNQKKLQIKIGHNDIPSHNKIKILGIIFDSKLNWILHLKHLKNSITKKLNIIKIISHTTWGGESSTLLKIYRALISSRTDYGSIIFKTANPKHLNTLKNTKIKSHSKSKKCCKRITP